MDEKGFLIGLLQKAKRVISRQAFEDSIVTGAGQDGNRQWLTILATICMDGTFLPPGLIYESGAGNLMSTWFDDFKPDEHEAFFAASESGWSNEDIGFSWLTNIFDRYSKPKARNGRDYRLLFIDGHTSHVNLRFLKWCEKHRIAVALYPSHSTHRLQALDVAIFSPLANYYSTSLDSWIQQTKGLTSMGKREFFGLFYPAFLKAFTKDNIESGWRKTGLYPFDPEVVLSKLPRPSQNVENDPELVDPTNLLSIRKAIIKVNDAATHVGKMALQMANTLAAQNAEIQVLKRDLAGTKEAHINTQKRQQRGHIMIDTLKAVNNGNVGGFYSPKKIRHFAELVECKPIENTMQQGLRTLDRFQQQLQRDAKQLDALNRKNQRDAIRLGKTPAKKQKPTYQHTPSRQQQLAARRERSRALRLSSSSASSTTSLSSTDHEDAPESSREVVRECSRTGRPQRPQKMPYRYRNN